MSNVPFTVFLVALIVFTILDKGLTLVNLQQVQKNFPEADTTKVEKNPVAKFAFDKLGFWGGTIAMFFFSIGYYILIWYGVSWIFPGKQNVFLYIFFVVMSFVVGNNLYFLLKYSKVIF